ncbi:MAG: hypothetical protein H0V95_01600 [Actinobacteria bacterium]|nr:hypothetical protein [Actinomycetota bacterium]
MTLETKEWQELSEGAREVFGPARAAIFMSAMDQGFRADLATRGDVAQLQVATRADMAELRSELRVEIAGVRAELSELKATVESKLRAQTWTMVTVLLAGIGASRFF